MQSFIVLASLVSELAGGGGGRKMTPLSPLRLRLNFLVFSEHHNIIITIYRQWLTVVY